MDFEEVGSILRNERERKGLSIEVVMEATKISKTNILAMESGDKSGLPHPVYAKGFVKSYARYLGLDGDDLCMVVDREYQDHTNMPREHGYEVAPLAEKAFHDHEGGEGRKRRSGLPLFLVIVILAALAGSIFFLAQRKDADKAVTPAATSEKTQAPAAAAPAAAPDAAPASEAAPAGEPGEPAAGQPAASQSSADLPGAAAQAETAPAEPAIAPPVPPPARQEAAARDKAADLVTVGRKDEDAAKASAEEEQAKQKYDHILVIRATTEKGCWIGVWKGDEVQMTRDFVLKEGEPLRLMFNYPRRIRIGNVAGVSVSYNGKPYSLDQKKGNIQTLTFGAE
ncbi:helix-turn-helix domain-containing protein [Pseudodesulfovibrio sp.]|uniref:helix-turn-helix domain-containing protein n=1 Tax=Pseudodesulfovibrio sp. TaxID=2035812 RepID=UPI002631A57C|nr:helix-turn-helix domain-containing protein [Pseudodesulfovibrio sp.]MDD3313088.1 DUF4115 domain-containing protein [Pseudodesulfovibrio sp.]